MKKQELQEKLEREQRFSKALYEELKQLKIKYYSPISRDLQMKEEAVDFGKFLITMNVSAVNYPISFKTNTGLAPDIITESMEDMYERHIKSKVPFH